MFIPVTTVVKSNNDEGLFITTQTNARVEFIKDFRVWHRKPEHQNIEGPLTKVIMFNPVRNHSWFIIINESVDSFRDRVNQFNTVKECQTSQKTS